MLRYVDKAGESVYKGRLLKVVKAINKGFMGEMFQLKRSTGNKASGLVPWETKE